jgi:hypothetical protein
MALLEEFARKTQTPVHPDFENEAPNDEGSVDLHSLQATVEALANKIRIHEIEHRLRDLER